jgi:hypothetical protein
MTAGGPFKASFGLSGTVPDGPTSPQIGCPTLRGVRSVGTTTRDRSLFAVFPPKAVIPNEAVFQAEREPALSEVEGDLARSFSRMSS